MKTYKQNGWEVPEGFVIVPIEPNREMVMAGEEANDVHLDLRLDASLGAREGRGEFANWPSEETHELCSRVEYRAMIKVAPQPPVKPETSAEPVGWPRRYENGVLNFDNAEVMPTAADYASIENGDTFVPVYLNPPIKPENDTETPVGYVHLVPNEHSDSYDVRFWEPVAIGTKLYATK